MSFIVYGVGFPDEEWRAGETPTPAIRSIVNRINRSSDQLHLVLPNAVEPVAYFVVEGDAFADDPNRLVQGIPAFLRDSEVYAVSTFRDFVAAAPDEKGRCGICHVWGGHAPHCPWAKVR
jgi:hypothetical protein